MLISTIPQWTESRKALQEAYRRDEKNIMETLLIEAELNTAASARVTQQAILWVTEIRQKRADSHGIDAFLSLYSLSSSEGIALMCLAEALLRVPDKATVDALIRDKLSSPNWKTHLGKSESFFVNAATWGLVLTGKFLNLDAPEADTGLFTSLKQFFGRSSEPVIRRAIENAMRIMGKQFVMGETIKDALKRAQTNEKIGYRYSYDMLGEAARTAEDAEHYFNAYSMAISEIGKAANQLGPIHGPGISIKLSALHPRYEMAQRERVLKEMVPKLLNLAQQAHAVNIALTIDAEEAERLELSLDVMEAVFLNPTLQGFEGFGLAVQSYQKRASHVLDWAANLAKTGGRRLMVRLIKGAYWDTEIKQSQMQGLSGFPVFTRRCNTDTSYQACVKKLLSHREHLYPMFATHNAYSAAYVLEQAQALDYRDFEFQCLHGMGKELYDQIVPATQLNIPCRIYAPVGSHENLLPYLVRRLLENGANSSFVNQIVDTQKLIIDLVKAPTEKAKQFLHEPFYITLPEAIYPNQRKNSKGQDLSDWRVLEELKYALEPWKTHTWKANTEGVLEEIHSPTDTYDIVGHTHIATEDIIEKALNSAQTAFPLWNAQGASARAICLRKAADLLETHYPEFLALAIREAGKTINDAIAEVREAIDFCRYYAEIAEEKLSKPTYFQGYTGESNALYLHGRGPMLCISPWNFPLAIFIGQVTACLAAGNTVIAKPAEQTPLIAARAVEILHEAGVPTDVLQLLPGNGETVGAKLVQDERIKGVLFTGSTETAKKIAQTLAHREGAIVPLIAETGGLNAMIVDSSALLEQVTQDALTSAFGSAGQRCSALRVLFIQEEVADNLLRILKGAVAELSIGDPAWLKTDIGPVIDKEAHQMLNAHIQKMKDTATFICEASLKNAPKHGHFIAPTVFEISSLDILTREIFGPVLHIIRYKRDDLPGVVASINNSGYGLTLGIHSRLQETIAFITQNAKVGNCYVNRSMTGAVVGLQPFGGEGLSGTGPKAGGPHYVERLCVERVVTVNTTAAGGNALLMSQDSGE